MEEVTPNLGEFQPLEGYSWEVTLTRAVTVTGGDDRHLRGDGHLQSNTSISGTSGRMPR